MTVSVLDLSFNSLSSGGTRKVVVAQDAKKEEEVPADYRHTHDRFECSESAWKLRQAFLHNRTLMHVDISFNAFSAEDMLTIGDGLRENHTILGCHVEGNGAKIDALGFIKLTNSENTMQGNEVYGVHKYDRIPITMENEHAPKQQLLQRPLPELNQFMAAGPISGFDRPAG